MKAPKDKKALHSFQGMVNYLRRYSAKLTRLFKPLKPLLREETEWTWDFPIKMPSMPSKTSSPGPQYSRTLTERITRYSDWRLHVRIRCRIAARRVTSDLRIQISHSRWGTLFQHREGIARSDVRHVEASQLSVWWTSQSSSRSQTSRNDLEEEYCHCQPETSTTPSEACKIRNSSRVHLWEGQLNCRCPI